MSYGAMVIFGFAKMWFAHMLNHVAIMKELKAIQLRVTELGQTRA